MEVLDAAKALGIKILRPRVYNDGITPFHGKGVYYLSVVVPPYQKEEIKEKMTDEELHLDEGLEGLIEFKDLSCDDLNSEKVEIKEDKNKEIEADNLSEFASEEFDDEINNYLNESYEETFLYDTCKGFKDTNSGRIVLEGILRGEDEVREIKFFLEPTLNENLEETNSYTVVSDILREKFEFTPETK